jgi:AcrR family transcriptional regulator
VGATLGLSAPTAKIAKGAGVAEGTLFTYFVNKDELLNRLCLGLKMDLRNAMMTDYPASKSLIDRSRHVWDRYMRWGSAHPLKRRAMRQLVGSDRITGKSKKIVADAFEEVGDMMGDGLGLGSDELSDHKEPGPAATACCARRKKSLPRLFDRRRLKRNVNSSK